jgi:hypothetical protein
MLDYTIPTLTPLKKVRYMAKIIKVDRCEECPLMRPTIDKKHGFYCTLDGHRLNSLFKTGNDEPIIIVGISKHCKLQDSDKTDER